MGQKEATMHLIKITFLLSVLAVCQRPQVEAALTPKLAKFLDCAELVATCAADVLENSVTAFKVLADCVDFQPELKLNGSIVRFIKVGYLFVQRILSQKHNCVIATFNTAVSHIRPCVTKFDGLKCLDPSLNDVILTGISI